jgi:hypothetical protein
VIDRDKVHRSHPGIYNHLQAGGRALDVRQVAAPGVLARRRAESHITWHFAYNTPARSPEIAEMGDRRDAGRGRMIAHFFRTFCGIFPQVRVWTAARGWRERPSDLASGLLLRFPRDLANSNPDLSRDDGRQPSARCKAFRLLAGAIVVFHAKPGGRADIRLFVILLSRPAIEAVQSGGTDLICKCAGLNFKSKDVACFIDRISTELGDRPGEHGLGFIRSRC